MVRKKKESDEKQRDCPFCKKSKLFIMWRGQTGIRVYCLECGYSEEGGKEGQKKLEKEKENEPM